MGPGNIVGVQRQQHWAGARAGGPLAVETEVRSTPNIYSATTCQSLDCGPGIRARQEPNEDPAPNLTRGSAFHWMAAEYVRALVRRNIECDVRLADEILERGLRKFRLPPTVEFDLRDHWSRFVRGYLREHEVVGVEMGMAVMDDGSFAPFVEDLDHDRGNKARAAAKGFLWRGALDLVDRGSEAEPGGDRIIDWKTGMYVPSESELKTMFQPRQYCGAYALAYDIDPEAIIEFCWHSVPWGTRVVVEFTAGHVASDFLRWLDVFRGRDALPPDDPYWTTHRRTDGCSVCPARKDCPAWADDPDGLLLPRIASLNAELQGGAGRTQGEGQDRRRGGRGWTPRLP